MEPLIEDAGTRHPSEVINFLRVTLDLERYVTDDDLTAPDDPKIENINQLQLAASRFNSIQAFIDYTETFQDEAVSDNREGVRLMTIHKSKGLEFKIVMIVGLVENILPSKKGNLEEERRICFVAISRAQKILYLSHSLTYLGTAAKRSIFLDEILGNIQPPSRL